MHIGIFADGGYEKGMGHVVRMKRLAEELKRRCLITFYTNQESEPFLHEEHWRVIVKPKPQQHEFILREIKSKELDLLLFDILGAPAELLTKIKAETDAKIVLFEERNPKAIDQSDVIINGIYGDIRSKAYDQGNTRIYEGPDYLILHSAFQSARNDYTLKKECRNILVALGGSDPKQLIFRVLAAADQVPAMKDKNTMFVMGSASPHQEAVRRQIQKKPQYTVIGQTNDMAGLMKQADAAIVAGASLFMKPFVSVCRALFFLRLNTKRQQPKHSLSKEPLLTLVSESLYQMKRSSIRCHDSSAAILSAFLCTMGEAARGWQRHQAGISYSSRFV